MGPLIAGLRDPMQAKTLRAPRLFLGNDVVIIKERQTGTGCLE